MSREITLLFLIAFGSCMEMKEIVERMVVVRTTGSDLQPAATGFIYKKENDEAPSVIKMGESEVMEQLTKLYEQPKAFAAPIPVANGPFYGKEDEDKAASFTRETKVIPVVEVQDDELDGIASEDYGKIFVEYASDFPNYKLDFDDYLKKIGYFQDGLYREHGDAKNGDEQKENQGEEQYKTKQNSESAGDYHSEKFDAYKVSKEGSANNDQDGTSLGEHHANMHGYQERGYGNGGGFHTFFDDINYKKKENDFYNEEALKNGRGFADGSSNYGSDPFAAAGHKEDYRGRDFHDRRSYDEREIGDWQNDGEGEQFTFYGDIPAGERTYEGKSFGYEIKH